MELDTAMAKEFKENGVWVPLTPAKSVQGHAAADSEKEGDNCDGLFGNWNSSSVRFVSDYEGEKHGAAKDYSAGVANNFGVVGSGNLSSSLESLGLHQTPKGVTGGISDNGVFQKTGKVEVCPALVRGIELQNEHRQYNFGLNSSPAKASYAKKNQNPKEMSNRGSLNKKKRLKIKRHRPKIFDASKPKKSPKSKVNPSTPKQNTPKHCIPRTSPLQKSKCVRKAKEREVIGESSGCAINSCRQRLDFNLENKVGDQNGQDNYGMNEGKANSKVMGLSIQNDDHGRMEAGFQVSTNSLNVHEEAVEPISHYAAKSSINSLNDDFPSQARANSLEGMTPKTHSGQTDNLIPKECEESCQESIKLNFDFNLEVQDFDSSSRTRAITLQYQRRKKSLNNPALKEKLNGDEMIDKPEADSKVQSGCRSSDSLVYKRILRSNKCLRSSRKIRPNWPKIYKKKRMKRRRATASRNFCYTKVADECKKKVDRCIRQKVIPNSTAHRNVKKNLKRLSSPKFSKRTSQKRAKKSELSCDSAIGKYDLSVILPTQSQRMEAMNDPVSFKCVRSLCPMANFRKKRSQILKQKQRHCDAHLSTEKETNVRHPKPHDSALTLTRFVKAKTKRSMTSTTRHNISSFCYGPRTFFPKAYSVRNQNQDDDQEKLEIHIEYNQHLDMQYLIEIPYFEGQHLDQNDILSSQNEDAYGKDLIDFISQKFERLHIDDGGNQLVERDKKVHGALLPYKGKFDPSKRRKPPPKIDLDAETTRVWKLLMENDGSEGTEEVDVDKEKWWESEREVFRGRIDSFISCMHLIQGDRRFSPWKGSVVDSVVGVFLTQNVSDHLSSSAFMSLAARFPPPSMTDQSDYKNSVSRQESVDGNKADCGRSTDGNNEQPFVCSTEQDLEKSCICSTAKSLGGDVIICEDAVHGNPDSSSRGNSNTSSQPCNSEDSAMYRELLQVEENKFLQQFYSHEEKKMSHVEITSDKKFGDSQGLTRAFSSDKTSGLDGNAASCSPQSLNLMEDLGNIKIEDTRDIGKNHESTEGRKKRQVKDKKENLVNWDDLRKKYSRGRSKDTIDGNIDSVNWEAVRQSTVQEVAKVIMERGMNNILAGRIKDFLDRMVQDHGIIDLEWLRDVPPDKTKNFLLSIPGLGLKSTECVRLLTLHHHAFPVDTNVGRILVRLGWVPLLPLPEDVQIHLLNQYPLVDTIQKYIWPRLCTFGTQILYEFHYQMITFGKVFCTKIHPNCNACPMRGQCKHFASAYASARLRLQGSSVESKKSELPVTSSQDLIDTSPPQLVIYDGDFSGVGNKSYNSEPIVEFPPSPEPASRELLESDIEDFSYQAVDEIPTIKLNTEEFTKNILDFMEKTCFLSPEAAVSKELVALSPEAASIPMPKLKTVSRLRTVHQVYELPDSHPLLAGFEKREPDDPCPYLLAIWTTDETANSSQQHGKACNCRESTTCNMDACCSADTVQKQIDELIQGTILIPCRTANRGSFPLNGTYFQVNEVFADHESSRHPIAVPRKWIWNLRRRALYCGTSTTSIFRGLSTDEIQYCFWRGFICVRGMDRVSRVARPLARRFHICKTRLVDEE